MKSKVFRILIIVAWIAALGFFIGVPTTFLMVHNDTFGWFGGLPSLQDLERPDPDLSSELISADGLLLGKYWRPTSNRTAITYEELSSELVNTLLVTEDIRFKQHAGIDLRGLTRAIFGVMTFNFKGGGSTITMQLAENLYQTNSENQGSLYKIGKIGRIITKLKEYIIAVQLENSYTKEEILAMYLNQIEFGSNSLGIKVAAKTFFNKLPSQLDYLESSVLVGVINAPTRFSPVLNPENSLSKRAEVLYNVHKYGLISEEEFDSLKVLPLGLNYKVDNHNEGLATYFRSVIRPFLLYWSKENGYDLYDDGLKIYTTIDSRLQQFAEEAVTEHMKKLQERFDKHLNGTTPWIDEDGRELEGFIESRIKSTEHYKSLVAKFGVTSDSVEIYLNRKKPMTVFTWDGEKDTLFSTYDSLKYYKGFLHAGFLAMEPKTGQIKAWVGGINHKYFKYDHVDQGKRQPGSTFKPIVYTVAIENGYSPCYPVVDAAVTFPRPGQDPPTWTPENANGKFTGEKMTIRQAMARSKNSVTAYIMKEVGPQTVVEKAKQLGIESPLDAVPSLCLGAGGDVSIKEMVGSYSTFVNKGIYTEPIFITRIEDQNGNVIQQFVPQTREAINEETAYIMLHMLKGTTEEPGGTALGLDISLRQGNEIGAKTGTTQNASDGWFVGVTRDLAAGAWVGGDERSIHFRNWALGQGAKTAMPIWENFMLKVYDDPTLGYEKGSFDRPLKPISIELDCDKYTNGSHSSDNNQNQVIEEVDFM
ncbi:transglycosylase domain-containing protein [Marinoscillum sp. MHG1-6]|uniref:transglycosylase domain-containing protein n=1 Tax=Marinoscillum sp. MHG1-6 TaxID=2959627 RepID=UPI0021579E2A|nr:transglycosylase domain-containing protein [Marinoscillum sp. MHG1-6]